MKNLGEGGRWWKLGFVILQYLVCDGDANSGVLLVLGWWCSDFRVVVLVILDWIWL